MELAVDEAIIFHIDTLILAFVLNPIYLSSGLDSYLVVAPAMAIAITYTSSGRTKVYT
jgi:hypothetical protein